MNYNQTKHLVNEIAKSVGSEVETIWWPDCFPQILELMWLLSKHLQSSLYLLCSLTCNAIVWLSTKHS